MKIPHISISRKALWDTCHEAYKFKYHLEVEPPGPEPIYFSYGKMIHKIAEEYVNRKNEDQWHNIIAEVVNGQLEIEPGKKAPKLNDEYTRKFANHCNTLRLFINKIGLNVESLVEHSFKYDLNPPHEWWTVGFIDRIIKNDNKIIIIDYKTTKKGPWRKNKDTILKDLQLRMYCKVVQREFNVEAEDIKAFLYYLEGGDLIGAKFNQSSLDSAEEELREAFGKILEMEEKDVKPTIGYHCNRCDFRTMCKYFGKNKNNMDSYEEKYEKK